MMRFKLVCEGISLALFIVAVCFLLSGCATVVHAIKDGVVR